MAKKSSIGYLQIIKWLGKEFTEDEDILCLNLGN